MRHKFLTLLILVLSVVSKKAPLIILMGVLLTGHNILTFVIIVLSVISFNDWDASNGLHYLISSYNSCFSGFISRWGYF